MIDPELLIALTAQLKVDEGLRLKAYADENGKLTIGYGHNLTDLGISLDEAQMLLQNDIEVILLALPLRWPPFATLDMIRQQVIANMGFNIGLGGLMLFTHMLAACARGDYAQASAEMLDSTWARQVGPRAYRLAKMMQTGQTA